MPRSSELPATDLRTEVVLLTLHATEFCIHELALNFEESADPLRRLEILRSCLKSVEDWFQAFLDIPPSRHFGLNFSVFLHLVHAIVALFRLSTTDSIPSWDPAEVKSRLHLITVLDQVSEHLDQSDSALSIVKDDPSEETRKCRVLGFRAVSPLHVVPVLPLPCRGRRGRSVLRNQYLRLTTRTIVWSKSARVMRIIKRGVLQDYPVCPKARPLPRDARSSLRGRRTEKGGLRLPPSLREQQSM